MAVIVGQKGHPAFPSDLTLNTVLTDNHNKHYVIMISDFLTSAQTSSYQLSFTLRFPRGEMPNVTIVCK